MIGIAILNEVGGVNAPDRITDWENSQTPILKTSPNPQATIANQCNLKMPQFHLKVNNPYYSYRCCQRKPSWNRQGGDVAFSWSICLLNNKFSGNLSPIRSRVTLKAKNHWFSIIHHLHIPSLQILWRPISNNRRKIMVRIYGSFYFDIDEFNISRLNTYVYFADLFEDINISFKWHSVSRYFRSRFAVFARRTIGFLGIA